MTEPAAHIFGGWPSGYQTMLALDSAVSASGLDPHRLELIRTRASQMNQCAFCLHMHAQAALAHGEDPTRLVQLAAWRDSSSNTDDERAALALTEALTLAADGVPGDVLDNIDEHFEASASVQLRYAVATINSWNRLAIAHPHANQLLHAMEASHGPRRSTTDPHQTEAP